MSYILLGVTALILGLRHGTDIDHIAAILDMAGSSATEKTRNNNLRRILADMRFPLLYVIGHGLMVILLGVLALCFGAVIPHWFDQIMERIVGVTLLLLSAYLLYSLYLFATKGEEVKLKSRWMVLFAAIGNVWSWLSHKLFKHEHRSSQVANWDDKGALMIGAIHGFGAETGTQVLLFASVAGAGNIGEGYLDNISVTQTLTDAADTEIDTTLTNYVFVWVNSNSELSAPSPVSRPCSRWRSAIDSIRRFTGG